MAVIELDLMWKDVALLTSRISQALYTHSKLVSTDETDPDHGYSILAVSEDQEEGELEIAIFGGDSQETRVYKVKITEL